MSDKYQELLDEMKASGEVPDTWMEKIHNTYEASGLRSDLKETRDKYREALDREAKLRDRILLDQFKDAGITISPSALRIPDELDPTDTEKVSSWLVEMGLKSSEPTTSDDELSTHDRIASVSNNVTAAPAIPNISKMSEEEFWAAHAAGLLTPKK